VSNTFHTSISCVPVRESGSSTAEMVTQLLYGEPYEELGLEDDWIRVKCLLDGYEGYISNDQTGDKTEFSIADFQSFKRITSRFAMMGDMILSMGSILPGEEALEVDDDLFNMALRMIDAPYLWGGKNFMGVDCSGLVQVCARSLGVFLPRDASQQITEGDEVSWENIQRSDLAFFGKSVDKITHVGIVGDEFDIIHACGKVRVDELTEMGILRKEGDKKRLTHELQKIKRLS